jgi:O-antigen/teichoic acid export membrane protein
MSKATVQVPFQHVNSTSLWARWMAKVKGVAKTSGPRRLAASSIGALFVYAAGAGLSYLSQLVVARTIGPASFGIYSYVWAWVTMLAYLATLGFHVSLLRFVPGYRANQRWALMRGVVQFSQRGTAAVGVCVVLAGAGIIATRHSSMHAELAITFLIGIVTIPIISQHQINASLVRAFGGIVKALAPERVVRDGVLLIVVAIAAWSGMFAKNAVMAMAASLISALATLALLRYFLRALRPAELGVQAAEYSAKEWLKPTIPIMFIVIADGLMSRSGIIALGMSGNTLEAGVFAVALSMSLITALPRMAVSAAFAPNVSDLNARGDQVGLQSLAAKGSVLSTIGSLGVATPLIVFNEPLLALFGKEFVAGAPVTIILIVGQVFAAACGPQQHLITMTGNERSAAVIMIACALGNLVACVLAIALLGTIGAALAMTATLIIWNIVMAAYIFRRLHITPGLISVVSSCVKKVW